MSKNVEVVPSTSEKQDRFLSQLDAFRSDARGVQLKPRAREIAGIAGALLAEHGLERFSMRAVAERVGMSLAALQYHFPTFADLVRSMIDQRIDAYLDAGRTYLVGLEDDPQRAFATHINWYIADARSRATARFTAQFQALACTNDYAASALDGYMQLYRASLALFIGRVNPNLSHGEALRRGALIAAMLDGLMIVASPDKPQHAEFDTIDTSVWRAIQAIVRAPTAVERATLTY